MSLERRSGEFPKLPSEKQLRQMIADLDVMSGMYASADEESAFSTIINRLTLELESGNYQKYVGLRAALFPDKNDPGWIARDQEKKKRRAEERAKWEAEEEKRKAKRVQEAQEKRDEMMLGRETLLSGSGWYLFDPTVHGVPLENTQPVQPPHMQSVYTEYGDLIGGDFIENIGNFFTHKGNFISFTEQQTGKGTVRASSLINIRRHDIFELNESYLALCIWAKGQNRYGDSGTTEIQRVLFPTVKDNAVQVGFVGFHNTRSQTPHYLRLRYTGEPKTVTAVECTEMAAI